MIPRIPASWIRALILFPIATLLGSRGSPQPERSASQRRVAEREAVGVGPHGTERRTPLDRVLEAHGGLERFRAIRDWRIVADRKLDSSATPTEVYEEYLMRDGSFERTLLVKKRDGSLLVFGHDGQNGFALTDGKLRGDEGAPDEGYYRAHGEYYLRAIPFKWVDPGMSVTPAGRETTEGRELELFRITAAENVGRAWKDVWLAAVDRETHLLWEARLTHHRGTESWMDPKETGTTEIVYRYTDYREIAGLRIPHRLEYYSAGRKTGENVIRTIELDTGLRRETFRPDSWLDKTSGVDIPLVP